MVLNSFCLVGQSSKSVISRVTVSESNDDNSSQEYVFQYKGKVLQRIINGSDLALDYYYSSDGKLNGIVKLSLQNEEDTLSKIQFVYNKEAKPQQTFIYTYHDGKLDQTQKIVNIYDQSQVLIKQNLYSKEDKIFVKTQDYTLSYDASHNVESCRMKEYNAKGKITSHQKFKYKYDKNPYLMLINPIIVLDTYFRPSLSTNQVTEIKIERSSPSGKVQDIETIKFDYIYDAKKNLTEINNSRNLLIQIKY